ncbi:MAG TPA: hypothetical protein VNT29_09890, partial [Candidatus Limnocylindrales bacterium]|nr:hypothetical protein [Candidatus Limnocylindrales bacterium]
QIRERRKLRTSVFAILIALTTSTAPAFANISPEFGNTTSSAAVNPPIQLAQANLPSGVGSLNDYMSQQGDGPSGAAVPQPGYSPQPIPPQSYYPQGVPSREWNNPYADPNAARSALIGAAVVGALAVGMWAWQQHEIHQAQQPVQPARRRFHSHRRAFE